MKSLAATNFHRLAKLLSLAAGILMLASLILAIAGSQSKEETGPPLLILMAIGFIFGMYGLDLLAAICQQRLNRTLAADDGRGYFLLLRSLKGSELHSATSSAGALNPLPNALVFDDLLQDLAEALSEVGPVFVLGTRETGSLTWSPNAIVVRSSDRSWRSHFAILSRGARAIFVIPGKTPGILEELTQIAEENLLNKVIVLMPPATGRDGRRSTWNSIAEAPLMKSWTLPSNLGKPRVPSTREESTRPERGNGSDPTIL